MTRRQVLKLLTDPDEDDLHELYNNLAQFVLSVVVAGCAILSVQKMLR